MYEENEEKEKIYILSCTDGNLSVPKSKLVLFEYFSHFSDITEEIFFLEEHYEDVNILFSYILGREFETKNIGKILDFFGKWKGEMILAEKLLLNFDTLNHIPVTNPEYMTELIKRFLAAKKVNKDVFTRAIESFKSLPDHVLGKIVKILY